MSERTTSLFALAIADVLIINMWAKDVGRSDASNYEILRDIFQVNMRLFDQKTAKKFLFIIRDFKRSGSNEEKTRTILKQDITNIWKKSMPEKYKDAEPDHFFHFDFVMLPHKRYKEKEFAEQAKQLRARFSVNAPNSLFLRDADQKNVPMDGMACFVGQNWEIITNEKDLDLSN